MPESASGGGLLQGACLLLGGCLLRGVSATGGVSAPGGCLLWGVCSQGVSVPIGSAPGGVVSQHALRQTPPPVNRMTNRCKNITLATTSLRPVTKSRDVYLSFVITRDLCQEYKIVVSVNYRSDIKSRDLFHFTGMPLTVVIIQSLYH